ncbi:GNAT family N-acetyltransferase [Amycolatopsis sp. NPDC059027]|uniref:GNAT family N-acetyltransferase n=1 Tax=Amycolatopsis sp. NPDC059027 TaxID=3346709 RepID=UPI00366AA15D
MAEQQNVVVTRSAEKDRYEITADGEAAGFAEFLEHEGRRVFFHTEIDERFAGRGLASALIARALELTRADGGRIVAVCPFVAKYVARHHDFDDILDPATDDVLAAVRASQ